MLYPSLLKTLNDCLTTYSTILYIRFTHTIAVIFEVINILKELKMVQNLNNDEGELMSTLLLKIPEHVWRVSKKSNQDMVRHRVGRGGGF